MMKMKINKISKKLIEPHTPTPPNLKNFNISFIDNYLPPMNVALLLFYQSKPENVDTQLEESLAKILVHFYPLAGRLIKNDHLVDCSDQGVEFVVAEALDDDDDLELTEVVAKTTHADQINDLFPDHHFRLDEGPTEPLMSIQTTHFPCGGLTIGISISHRVFDASSLATFIAAWSNSNATNPADHKTAELTPQSFELPLLFPYKAHDFGIKSHNNNISPTPRININIVVKRLVFNKDTLTNLKSKTRPRNGKPVSGVRVVSAVLAKALIKVDTAKHGRSRDFKISQPVNMRERTIPPISKHACGNLSIPSFTRCVEASEAKEIGVEELVDLIGDAARKTITDYAEIVSPNIDRRMDLIKNTFVEVLKQRMYPDMNRIVFTDWSKFGFYEADFGWGKPVWASIGPKHTSSNCARLIGNREGDGIEAWVRLSEEDMRMFDQDEEVIKLFTT